MKEQRGFTGSQLTVAFFGGALAGAAVAILTAPRSGRETREQLGGYVRRRRQEKAARMPETSRSTVAIGNGMDEEELDMSRRR